MKHFYNLFFGLVLLLYLSDVNAQKAEPTKMLRFYEENDFFDIRGKGTDNSYSNGTRIDFFYEKRSTRGLLHRIMPKAGDSSRNVYGWSLMQIMVTPDNIRSTTCQQNDYYYAGALFATHSLYSYNASKKYSLQTELLLGIRGPASFAEQTQKGVHKLINYQEPMGWDNQLRTQPLVNLRFGFEKNILSINNFIEVNGGSQIKVGSFMDLVTFYPMLRIGKMSPYFDGYMDKFGSFTKNGKQIKTQYYFVVKPSVTFVAYNAMLTGKREETLETDLLKGQNTGTSSSIDNCIADVQFGAVVALGNFALSYLQTGSTTYRKDLYHHNYGNFSLYFGL